MGTLNFAEKSVQVLTQSLALFECLTGMMK